MIMILTGASALRRRAVNPRHAALLNQVRTSQLMTNQQRNFSSTNSVYLWAGMPKVGLKGGAVKNAIEMPKGMPKRIEEYDELNV